MYDQLQIISVSVHNLKVQHFSFLKTFEAQGYQHMSVATHTVSFWTWVAMVNATGRNFFNELYSREVYPE